MLFLPLISTDTPENRISTENVTVQFSLDAYSKKVIKPNFIFFISICKFNDVIDSLTYYRANTTIFNNLRETFSSGPGFEPGSPALRAGALTNKLPRQSSGSSGSLVVIAPACRAGDPSLNTGPGENLSFKLLTYDLPDGYSQS